MKKALLKTAPKTSAETTERIKTGFSEYLNCELEWETVEDKTLIGGFLAYIDGTVYDCTVATALDTMKQTLSDAVRRESHDV